MHNPTKLIELTNEEIRQGLNEALAQKKSLPKREQEIKEMAIKEKENYEIAKKKFYDDPLHWSNNKRRRHGLHVLRGNVNKYRSKTFRSFMPSIRFFSLVEDTVNEILGSKLESGEYFNKFVAAKDLSGGDYSIFHIE